MFFKETATIFFWSCLLILGANQSKQEKSLPLIIPDWKVPLNLIEKFYCKSTMMLRIYLKRMTGRPFLILPFAFIFW